MTLSSSRHQLTVDFERSVRVASVMTTCLRFRASRAPSNWEGSLETERRNDVDADQYEENQQEHHHVDHRDDLDARTCAIAVVPSTDRKFPRFTTPLSRRVIPSPTARKHGCATLRLRLREEDVSATLQLLMMRPTTVTELLQWAYRLRAEGTHMTFRLLHARFALRRQSGCSGIFSLRHAWALGVGVRQAIGLPVNLRFATCRHRFLIFLRATTLRSAWANWRANRIVARQAVIRIIAILILVFVDAIGRSESSWEAHRLRRYRQRVKIMTPASARRKWFDQYKAGLSLPIRSSTRLATTR